MSDAMIRRVKERRADVHRRIGELRSELQILEARADEIERLLKDLVDDDKTEIAIPPGTYICEPNIAVGEKTSVGDLIIWAMNELEGAAYEYAERKAIFNVIERAGHRLKSNTLRVALRRLVEKGRVHQVGNLYCLAPETKAASAEAFAA